MRPASTAAVIVSVFAIEAVTGLTPFIATTVRVIMALTLLYFFVHTAQFICEQLQTNFGVETLIATVESVMFVPMMRALFLGTRMRALQLSRNKGAPQGWAQDFMMLATWAIFFDLVMVQELFNESLLLLGRCVGLDAAPLAFDRPLRGAGG